MHLDIRCRLPPPQVTEQDENSLQDDQVGHDGVLHDSFFVRLTDPLPNAMKSLVLYLTDHCPVFNELQSHIMQRLHCSKKTENDDF